MSVARISTCAASEHSKDGKAVQGIIQSRLTPASPILPNRRTQVMDREEKNENEDVRIEKNGWTVSLSLDWPEWVLLTMAITAISYFISGALG